MLRHVAREYMAFQRDGLSVSAEHPHVYRRLFIPYIRIPFTVMIGIIIVQMLCIL